MFFQRNNLNKCPFSCVLDATFKFYNSPCKCHIASQIFNKFYIHCLFLSLVTLTTLLNKLKLLINVEKQYILFPYLPISDVMD